MAKGKQRSWHNLDGLYRDVEDARRHADHGTSDEGARAWERWLELLDIALNYLEERESSDSADLEGAADAEELDSPDAGDRPLFEPSRSGGMADEIPRGTPGTPRSGAPVVGAVADLSDHELARELERRGMTAGKVKLTHASRS